MGKERGEVSDKLLLKKTVRKKAEFLLKKPNLDPVEVYNLVKRFFRLYLGNEYEYTREELVEELNKFYLEEENKRRLVSIVKSLGRVEFSQPEFSQDELKSMLEEFVSLVEKMVHEETKQLNFMDKIASKFKAKAKNPSSDKESEEKTQLEIFAEEVEGSEPVPEEEDVQKVESGDYSSQDFEPGGESQKGRETLPDNEQELTSPPSYESKQETEEPSNSKFEMLLSEFYDNLDSDLMEARINYAELAELYEEMGDDEKRVYYSQMSRAYEDINDKI